MPFPFSLPTGAVGRFAIVKLWPDIKTAEDECIARLKIAAQMLGIECVEVNAEGRFLHAPELEVSRQTVDFVIHLHYDTPKRYDAFSFVALWNPVKFYHEWGYERCSRNLTTHDDFISCSSGAADDHVARMIRGSKNHLPARFHLYHSIADVVHPPSLGAGMLFYAGINWETVTGAKSRHQEVLKRLDTTGLLRIYGPTIFSGVRVWAGYQSYVSEVPFDGVSMMDEIAKAGIALVLSSPAHKDSELMSNRLFESVAAGALVICDENPFGKRYFGDSLLYIDSRSPIEEMLADIVRHIEWARQNPEAALAMIAKAQQIFREKFTLVRNLSDIYLGLAERKQQLNALMAPPDSKRLQIRLHLLMPEYSEHILQRHIRSIAGQSYSDFTPVLVIDSSLAEDTQREIAAALETLPVAVETLFVAYERQGIHPDIKRRRRMGEVFQELLSHCSAADAFMVVAPNESLLSNHLAVLAGALQREQMVQCAATAAVLLNGEAPVHAVHEVIDFGHVNRQGPCGYGRFIFRISGISADVGVALPYLDGRPLAVLLGEGKIAQQLPASISIDIQREFPTRDWDDAAENEVIRDFNPSAFAIYAGRRILPTQIAMAAATPQPTALQLLKRMSSRRWVAAQIHAIRKHGLKTRLRVLKQRLGWAA